ncbi:unknown protein [Seminavis robusta]|uniref:Uncharacterized protein n=1 Tax=Seminavis robusta TaxID=568900 RepID=A0A9N8DP14_9STRA|nr:unknown protein [Seminavis robusta]|eukprot:Sro237_g095360.1 n/a (153) ;mRNA; f:67186-67644
MNEGTQLWLNDGRYQHQPVTYTRPDYADSNYCYVTLCESSEVVHVLKTDITGPGSHAIRHQAMQTRNWYGTTNADDIAAMGAWRAPLEDRWRLRSERQQDIIEMYRIKDRKRMLKTIKNLKRELQEEKEAHESLKRQCRDLYKVMVEESEDN